MDVLLLALAVVFVCSTGGRDQLLMARLAAVLGRNGALLVLALAISGTTAVISVLAGAMLPEPARLVVASLALFLAAADLLRPVRVAHMREPTRSLGAIGLVLFTRQFIDAPRLALLTLATMGVQPAMAGAGGALGGAGALALAWMMGEQLEARLPLHAIRTGLGAAIGLLAVWTALLVVQTA